MFSTKLAILTWCEDKKSFGALLKCGDDPVCALYYYDQKVTLESIEDDDGSCEKHVEENGIELCV